MRTPYRLKLRDILLDFKKLNEIFFMRLVSLFLLNVLAFNAFAAEDLSDFEKGLRVLLELELNKFESCLEEGKTDCDDSEVDNFLRLLDEGRPVTMAAPDYPRNALRSGISAVVVVQITVSHLGEVSEATAILCESGKGPASLKYQWKQDGQHCSAFRKAARRAALEWSYSPVTLMEREVYARYARVNFELQWGDKDPNEMQIVEIKKRDRKKISKFKERKAWAELREFVENRQDESPVFTYHLATAQAGLGDRSGSVVTLERFLERAENQYFHYGAQAASTVIDVRYSQENDAAVVAAGDSYNLMHYYANGTQISKYKVGLSLMRFASSLTFVTPQQLGRSLSVLSHLEQHIGLVEDPLQRQDLEDQVSAQLDNIRAQLRGIGSKVSSG